MLTESEIEYCLSKIRQQLTMPQGSKMKPNIDNIIAIVKQTLAAGYGKQKTDDSDSVFHIGLLDKTAAILDQAGYENVRALRGATPDELLALRNFGTTALCEVRRRLADRGVRLRDDSSISDLRLCGAKNSKLKPEKPRHT